MISRTFAAFGWEPSEHFWQQYHLNAWVYNLANALVVMHDEVTAMRDRETTTHD